MSNQSPYKEFIFEEYAFDAGSNTACFRYSFDSQRFFEERVAFTRNETYDERMFERVTFNAFILAGVSYYKSFPTKKVSLRTGAFTSQQAAFFSEVYLHGLSQFVFENSLQPEDIARFEGAGHDEPISYDGTGTLVLQSGGKDSLLLAELLKQRGHDFSTWYMSSGSTYPEVLKRLEKPLRTVRRTIDRTALKQALQDGGLNGHVPVTFIALSYALMDAVLHDEATILVSIGREGEEAHAYIGDYAITHQWSKTWRAEKMFADYINDTISSKLRVGSPLRSMSELKVAEQFSLHAWSKYSHEFSSCNVANYEQGHDVTHLVWCANCPKCANSFLLFAPFVAKSELYSLFGGDLFTKPALSDTYKGLLGIDEAMKPFECVGEIDELRFAYAVAQKKGYEPLPFMVPDADFDIESTGPAQSWATQMIQ